MKRLLLFALAAVALVLAVPAATHSGGQYYTTYAAEVQLISQGATHSGVVCYGLTGGGHYMTQWPPYYYKRYTLFDCYASNIGVRRYHVTSSGSMVWDQSMWTGPAS